MSWEKKDFPGSTEMAMRMHQIQYERANRLQTENEQLRKALETAYDAIAHAENNRQEAHVADYLRKAKLVIVDVLHKEHII